MPGMTSSRRTTSTGLPRTNGSTEQLCDSVEKPQFVVLRSDRKINEHDGVTRVPVGSPCTICSQFLERTRDLTGITSDVKLHRFKNCCDHIANVCSDHVTPGI